MRRNRARALVALAAACGLAAAVGVTQAVGASRSPDAQLASNAKRVNGISASRKPAANKLVPLAGNGAFPASTINPNGGKGRTYRGIFSVEGTGAGRHQPDRARQRVPDRWRHHAARGRPPSWSRVTPA